MRTFIILHYMCAWWLFIKMMKGVEVDTGFPISELFVDGGMTVDDLLLQIQANFINGPVGMVILQWYIHVNESILSITIKSINIRSFWWHQCDEVIPNWNKLFIYLSSLLSDLRHICAAISKNFCTIMHY